MNDKRKNRKFTICNMCGGEAEWWDEKEGYVETHDRGKIRRRWITRYHQCLGPLCGEKLDLGSREYEEKDITYYSNEERRVYNL